jgi:hypothetical protein
MSETQNPNTISDKTYADLQRRAQKAALPMFSREATVKRQQQEAQRRKAQQS